MNKLKQARIAVGLTQKDVAMAVGIAESAYRRYETRKVTPNVKVAIKISKMLNESVEILFSEH